MNSYNLQLLRLIFSFFYYVLHKYLLHSNVHMTLEDNIHYRYIFLLQFFHINLLMQIIYEAQKHLKV